MIRVSNLHLPEVNFLAQEIKRNLLAFNFTIPYSVPQSVGDSKKDIDQPYFWQAHVANSTCNVNFPPTAPRYMDSIGKVHYGRAL